LDPVVGVVRLTTPVLLSVVRVLGTVDICWVLEAMLLVIGMTVAVVCGLIIGNTVVSLGLQAPP